MRWAAAKARLGELARRAAPIPARPRIGNRWQFIAREVA